MKKMHSAMPVSYLIIISGIDLGKQLNSGLVDNLDENLFKMTVI